MRRLLGETTAFKMRECTVAIREVVVLFIELIDWEFLEIGEDHVTDWVATPRVNSLLIILLLFQRAIVIEIHLFKLCLLTRSHHQIIWRLDKILIVNIDSIYLHSISLILRHIHLYLLKWIPIELHCVSLSLLLGIGREIIPFLVVVAWVYFCSQTYLFGVSISFLTGRL